MIKYPKNPKLLVGRAFLKLCPTFEQEGVRQRKLQNRVSVNVSVSYPYKKSLMPHTYIDQQLVLDVWEKAREFRTNSELSFNANGLNPLAYSVEACVINHQGSRNRNKFVDNWGSNVELLRYLAKNYRVIVHFDEDLISMLLDENLKVIEAWECDDGGC